MRHREISLFVAAFMLLGIPAYAYGDPSGGTLFQILMPMLAGVWAMWMILANRIRRTVTVLVRKLRESGPDEPAA
jgi:hypothetical protein